MNTLAKNTLLSVFLLLVCVINFSTLINPKEALASTTMRKYKNQEVSTSLCGINGCNGGSTDCEEIEVKRPNDPIPRVYLCYRHKLIQPKLPRYNQF